MRGIFYKAKLPRPRLCEKNEPEHSVYGSFFSLCLAKKLKNKYRKII